MANGVDEAVVDAMSSATDNALPLANVSPGTNNFIKMEDPQPSVEQFPESSPTDVAGQQMNDERTAPDNKVQIGSTVDPATSADAPMHEKKNGQYDQGLAEQQNGLSTKVALEEQPAADMPDYNGLDEHDDLLKDIHEEPQPPQDKRAFARLVFSDYSYYMLTLSVVIGRDLAVARAARRQKDNPLGGAEARQLGEYVTVYEPLQGADDSDAGDAPPPEEQDEYDEVHIAIREPEAADGSMSLGKNISRKHARIRYSFEHEGFELVVLGRNGLFVNDIHYEMGDARILPHGTRIQIGAVRFTFELPNNLGPGSGMSMSAYSMSFEDEAGEEVRDEGFVEADFDDYDIQPPRHHIPGPDDEEGEDEDSDDKDDLDEESDEDRLARPNKSTRKRGRAIQPPVPNKKKKHVRRGSSPVIGKTAKAKPAPGKHVKKPSKTILKFKSSKRDARRDDDAANGSDSDTSEAVQELSKQSRPHHGEKKPAVASPEASKTTKSSAEPAKPLVNRDQVLINGEGVNIEGLQPGTIIPPRRKGPGRPPKDGVMSKRERSLLLKDQKDRERALKMGIDPNTIPPINWAAPKAPPKPKPDNREFQFNASRSSEPTSAPGPADPLPGDKRDSLPSKDAREPSPEMKESDYTQEQLERPAGNYVTIIHEILSERGRMNLQQIYSAIERKYPYFKFRQQTTGWQSSVRHNLGQHDAFRKAEKDGKGFLWEINPDVPIEPARKPKKQPTPPPTSAYNNQQYGQPRYPPQGSQYSANGYPQQGRPPNYQSPQASTGLNGATPGQRPGNYSSPYGANSPPQHNVGGAGQGQGGNRASPAQMAGQSSSHSPANAHSPNGPPGQNQGHRRAEHNPWSRDTLINTVKKIYATRVDTGVSLDDVAVRAVDAFMNPAMKFAEPLGRLERDIVMALQQAHHSQVTGIPVQSGAHPQHQSSHGPPTGPPAQVPHASSVPGQGPATTAVMRSSSQQGQSSGPARVGTPQAPQPEPLTRPNSVQDVRQSRSHTPSNEPPSTKANMANASNNENTPGASKAMERTETAAAGATESEKAASGD